MINNDVAMKSDVNINITYAWWGKPTEIKIVLNHMPVVADNTIKMNISWVVSIFG